MSSRTSLDRLCRSGALAALLCDLDGTLVDSKAGLRAVYRDFVRAHGGAPSDAEFAALDGPAVGEIVARLKTTHSLSAAPEALERDYRARLSALYGEGLRPRDGAEALLAAARAAGLRLALVTAAPRAEVETLLAVLGWIDAFEVVICADNDCRAKPAPDLYLAALATLDIAPEAALAVEDSANGAAAARAAGLPVALVADGPGVDARGATATDLARLSRMLMARQPA